MKTWRAYLEGLDHFDVWTDHHSLRYFHTQANLSRRQARWNEHLGSYNFEIRYKPGVDNSVPDAASRRPDYADIMKIVALLPGNCAHFSDGDVSFNQNFIDSLTSSNSWVPPAILNEISISRIYSSLLDKCRKALEVDDQLHPYLHFLGDPTLPRPSSFRFNFHSSSPSSTSSTIFQVAVVETPP